MGNKRLSVLLSLVLVLGLLMGACAPAEPTKEAAAEPAAEEVVEEAAADADADADAKVEEAIEVPVTDAGSAVGEAVAADAAVDAGAKVEEAAIAVGDAAAVLADAAKDIAADAAADAGAEVEEAVAVVGEAVEEAMKAAKEAADAAADAADTAKETAVDAAADAGAKVEEAVAAAAEAVEEAMDAAKEAADAAKETTGEAVADAAEKVKEAADAVTDAMASAEAVKPEDLYKAEDDGSFETMSWSLGASDIPTIDPALSTDTSSNQIIQLIYMGLTMQNEVTAEVENGVATKIEKSEVADDGSIKYTYTIRTDIPWVRYNAETEEVEPVVDCDGNVRFLTAHDFEYAIKRSAAPETASDYAYMVGDYVVGAADYFAGVEGVTADDVMVKAVDDATLEITWVAEFAANNMIAGIWTYNAVPSWVIDGDEACDLEGAGDLWSSIETVQTYGPYAAKEWIHDDSFTVIKNPYWPADIEAVPQPKIEEVVFRILDSSAALAEFESGNLTGMSEVPTSELDRLKADPELSEALSIGEDMCTYYYGFNTTAQFVNDARVRRALSMAIDRQSLVDNVTKAGQVPAQWFSRPGLLAAPTLEDHPDLGVKFDPEGAKALIEEYMADEGIEDPMDITVEIVHNSNENHQRIAVAVQQMWKDNLGINALISNQEWAVYLKTIRSLDTPQVYRLGWCQDYMDAANFLNDSVSSGGSANPTVDGIPGAKPTGGLMWYNEEYENLVDTAQTLTDTAERLDLYAQAEEILVYEDAAMAPLYWYTRAEMSSPELDRTYSILGGKENFYKWSYK